MWRYCLSHGKNYKNAACYDVSCSQVYDWVWKYVAGGESGLIDRRGHHKADDEVDETKHLRRENQRLKRQLEEQERLVAGLLLKKMESPGWEVKLGRLAMLWPMKLPGSAKRKRAGHLLAMQAGRY